jgi:putative sterol carrier protein
MAKTFPSDEWFEELQERLNDSEAYGEQAAGYGVDFNGDYIFTVEAGDGLPETHHYFLGLEDGDCTEMYPVDSPAEADNGFQFSGSYDNWQKLVRGEMGAIEGIMGGDFELDGSMNTLLKYQDAAATLVETCSDIETEFA